MNAEIREKHSLWEDKYCLSTKFVNLKKNYIINFKVELFRNFLNFLAVSRSSIHSGRSAASLINVSPYTLEAAIELSI